MAVLFRRCLRNQAPLTAFNLKPSQGLEIRIILPMKKKIIFLLNEDLSCKDAILTFGDGRSEQISVNKESEFLSRALGLVGIGEYWMQTEFEIQKNHLTTNAESILKILKHESNACVNFNSSEQGNELNYEVFLGEKVLDGYSLTWDLIDVHLIEHLCGIFKCLGYQTDLTIEN